MTTENQETGSSVSQDASLKIDNSRRSFAKKSATIAPVLMTLANKTALGATPYHCTVSGQQSGNHSGNHDFTTPCNVGFSPGAWMTPLSGNGQGSLDQWLKAGAVPFEILLLDQKTTITCQTMPNRPNRSIKTTTIEIKVNNNWYTLSVQVESNIRNCTATGANPIIVSKKYYIDPYKTNPVTKDISGLEHYFQSDTVYDQINNSGLGTSPTEFSLIFGGSSTDSLYDILNKDNGSLDWHAIADWLNAGLNAKTGAFSPVYDDISQAYIVSVYQSSMSIDDKKNYFILIHH